VLQKVMKPGFKLITSLRDPVDKEVSRFYFLNESNFTMNEVVEQNKEYA